MKRTLIPREVLHMTHSKFVDLNGGQIHYAEFGATGPALVIVHGITGSYTSFMHLIPALVQQAHVYALDLRGHHLSGRTPGAYQLADYGQDVAAFLQTVVGQPAMIVGHSLGGLIAIWLASNAPTWVRSIFLEEPPLFITRLPRFQQTPFYGYFTTLREQLRQHHTNSGTLEEMVALVAQSPANAEQTMLEAAGPEAVRQRAIELHHLDPTVLDVAIAGILLGQDEPEVLLQRARCPAHLLTGQIEFGGAVDAADVQRILAGIPHCTHTPFAQTGHLIHREKPQEYLEALQHFVSAREG